MNFVKRIMLFVALLIICAVFSLNYGYKSGYDHGKQVTNAWWIDKKSRHYETSDVIKKRRVKKHHLM